MNTPMKTIVPALLASALMAACGKTPETTPAPATTAPATTAPDSVAPAATAPAATTTTAPAPATGDPDASAPTVAAVPAGTVGAAGTSEPTAAPVAVAPAGGPPSTAPTAKPGTTAASATAAVSMATPPTAPAATKPAATTPPTGTARDPGTLTRSEVLRARPFADAAEVATLATGTVVNIDGREGGWYQVSSNGKSGWVRMLAVRRSSVAGSSIEGLAGVASGRSGTGSVVSTTGIRGLDSQALTAAAFSEERIARAESFRTSRQDADAFARQGGLAVRDVPALPAPKK